jgi:HD-like signal output (HDOD) protein
MHQVKAKASGTSFRTIPPTVLQSLLRVRPLSPVAARLLTLTEEQANLRAISALIDTDPALSALVLRMVNSPLFGMQHQVTGVLHALALLGLERLRVVVTTAALRMFVTPALASPALMSCWRHSVACALAAQELAVSSGYDGDRAYTAGLLHDIGRFAMLSCWPKEYTDLLAKLAIIWPPTDSLQEE